MRKGWTETTFGEVAHLEKGISYKSSELCSDDDGIPFINLKSIDRGGGYRGDGLKWYSGSYKATQIVNPGDLILCCTDLTKHKAILGYPILVPNIGIESFAISLDLAKIIVDETKISRQYLFLLLQGQQMRSFMQSRSSGTTVIHLKTSEVPTAVIQLPPPTEQKRIVDLISTVDSYLEALEQRAGSARKSRNAVLHEMLSSGGEGWTETTLGEIAEVIGGGTPSTNVPMYWGNDVVWLTPTEIVAIDGKTVSDSVRKLTHEGLANSGAQILPKGSVILTSRASVGFVAISECELSTNQGFQSLVPKEKVLAYFLMYWIQNNRNEFESRAAGSTFKEISKTNVKSIKLNLPPLTEQKRIVDLISSMDDEISATEKLKYEAKQLRSGLLSDLLSGEHEIPESYDKVMGAA
jgi:type I restriction enzyme S subunit